MEIGEVRIIDGKLSLITSGVGGSSNYWWWRTIRKDGTLGRGYEGYDNGHHKFSKPIQHEKIIKVDLFDILKGEA